jgi:hypothetical protein
VGGSSTQKTRFAALEGGGGPDFSAGWHKAEAEQLGAKVILTTVFPVGEVPLERKIVWSPAIGEAVKIVNEQIHAKASDTVFIFDAYELMVADRGLLNRDFAVDELHLNDAGYAQLNQQLIQFLRILP